MTPDAVCPITAEAAFAGEDCRSARDPIERGVAMTLDNVCSISTDAAGPTSRPIFERGVAEIPGVDGTATGLAADPPGERGAANDMAPTNNELNEAD
mmetsp:Transcript_41979/g.110828  ORF Transcript_41979/g.110828 Transcript_41979/m.110828 type:complete len:97 (+) Transcript_41979:785-1075(+)